MTLLTAHLPFALSSPGAGSSKEHALALPPAGTHVVLSDSLNSPADFALSHFVFAAVSCKRKVRTPGNSGRLTNVLGRNDRLPGRRSSSVG